MTLRIIREKHSSQSTSLNGDELALFYRRELDSAVRSGRREVVLPLISCKDALFPEEEGLRTAVDEINGFADDSGISVTLAVPSRETPVLTGLLIPDMGAAPKAGAAGLGRRLFGVSRSASYADECAEAAAECMMIGVSPSPVRESGLEERMSHLSDSFSRYLMFLIEDRGMTNAEVYKRAVVDRKVFSKIKNDEDYHPQKITALCLCIGAKLNLDETRDLLGRAGYALSPSDRTDIIFSYFIENGIYDMIELDIVLEEYGLPCVIT